jgi:hypothetical protein
MIDEKIKLRYSILKLLFTYLVQLDLSLDRSLWAHWADLKDFYASQKLKPTDLVVLLRNTVERSRVNQQRGIGPFFKRLSAKYLLNSQIDYCCVLLEKFQLMLGTENVDKNTIETLRVEVVDFAFDVVRPKIRFRDRRYLQSIEHFNQSLYHSHLGMESLLKEISSDIEKV